MPRARSRAAAPAPTPAPTLPAHTEETLRRFLRAHVAEAKAEGLVVGVSGGLDSALVLRLSVDAIGAERVAAYSLPDARRDERLLQEVRDYASGLGAHFEEIPIAPLERPFLEVVPPGRDRVAAGNIKARIRMIVLYQKARERRALVAGTGNKSELLLGYFTKYGDGGVDLLPIGDLYKTGVRELAERLGLPRPVRERAPTAGLWEGQTDEAELGLPYELLDRVLGGFERLQEPEEVADALGLPRAQVEQLARRVQQHRHKRRTPPIPKVGVRTLGLDWRD